MRISIFGGAAERTDPAGADDLFWRHFFLAEHPRHAIATPLASMAAHLTEQPYYHGTISREESERRLMESGLVQGMFLLRVKIEDEVYAISAVGPEKSIVHCLLRRTGDRYFLDEQELDGCGDFVAAVARAALRSQLPGFPLPYMGKACLSWKFPPIPLTRAKHQVVQ